MKKLDFNHVKQLMQSAKKLNDYVQFMNDDQKRQEKEVEEECSRLIGLRALEALEGISVDELKNSKAGIRTSALREAGYDNLLQLAKLKDWELTAFGTGHSVNPDFGALLRNLSTAWQSTCT